MTMNREEYFKRARGIFRPETLCCKRAAVVGCGAGGGHAGTDLGRAGLGLLLIDRAAECLEEHNILRHVLGYSSLGKPKTAALCDHIHNYNPEAEIATAECDVMLEPQRLAALLSADKSDLVLDCLDNESAKHALNATAVRLGLPVVGGAVYDGGVGGHVYRTGPGEACYACIAPWVNLRAGGGDRPATIDYSNPDIDALQSTCALNPDIQMIANIQARLALQVLLGNETDLTGLPRAVNLIIFANRVHPQAFPRPLHATFHIIPRNPLCLICGQPKGDDLDKEAQSIVNSIP